MPTLFGNPVVLSNGAGKCRFSDLKRSPIFQANDVFIGDGLLYRNCGFQGFRFGLRPVALFNVARAVCTDWISPGSSRAGTEFIKGLRRPMTSRKDRRAARSR